MAISEDPKYQAKLKAIKLSRIADEFLDPAIHYDSKEAIIQAVEAATVFWEHCKENGLCPDRNRHCSCGRDVW